MLVLGFALVYLPWIHTFLLSTGHLRTPFLEAIYYSTTIATSLGNGDMVADPGSLPLQAGRLLFLLRGLEGAALGGDPSIVPLQRAVMRYLTEVNLHLVPAHFHPAGTPGAAAASEAQYDRVSKYLRNR